MYAKGDRVEVTKGQYQGVRGTVLGVQRLRNVLVEVKLDGHGVRRTFFLGEIGRKA